ncbi:hypothetical protein B0H13DRAFT_2683702 [Mycena leptocephala]|nr:hypothetical protein B0H13DRAFT_2683702 [Mycena leptocephala]
MSPPPRSSHSPPTSCVRQQPPFCATHQRAHLSRITLCSVPVEPPFHVTLRVATQSAYASGQADPVPPVGPCPPIPPVLTVASAVRTAVPSALALFPPPHAPPVPAQSQLVGGGIRASSVSLSHTADGESSASAPRTNAEEFLTVHVACSISPLFCAASSFCPPSILLSPQPLAVLRGFGLCRPGRAVLALGLESYLVDNLDFYPITKALWSAL